MHDDLAPDRTSYEPHKGLTPRQQQPDQPDYINIQTSTRARRGKIVEGPGDRCTVSKVLGVGPDYRRL